MSRKYKQGGYMEEAASGRRKPSTAGGRPEAAQGPRGRGLGAPRATVFRCSRCGHLQPSGLQAGDALPVDATCTECGSDLHTCRHCAHFDTSATYQCRREIAHRIAKKDRRNECELFEVKLTQEFAAEAEPPGSARAAFDDLFNL